MNKLKLLVSVALCMLIGATNTVAVMSNAIIAEATEIESELVLPDTENVRTCPHRLKIYAKAYKDGK